MNEVEVLFERCRAALARTRHATYRLQLGPLLRFDDVAALAPYLSALGISEAYLSPCFYQMLVGAWPMEEDPAGLESFSLAGVYRDRFSGRCVVTEARDGGPALLAGSLFGSFPAALLQREEAP